MDVIRSRGQEAKLWHAVKHTGITRKGFLRLLGTGGSAAVLADLTSHSTAAQAPMRLFFKADYAEYFHKPWATELGSRWFDFSTFITPIERFFVRNCYASPDVSANLLHGFGRFNL
jgi:hypothetical protein